MNDSIVVAMTTYYEQIEDTRFNLACEAIEMAARGTYRENCSDFVVVVDDSHNPDVKNLFRKQGARVFHQTVGGFGSAKRQSAFIAREIAIQTNIDIIGMIEPEKNLAAHFDELTKPIREGRAGIVIPSRTEETWRTWPEFQIESEQQANDVFASVTGKHIDINMGPVFFSLENAKYFTMNNPSKIGVADRHTQHYGVLLAIRSGVWVESVPINWEYPRAQYEEEVGKNMAEMLKKRKQTRDELMYAYPRLWELAQQI